VPRFAPFLLVLALLSATVARLMAQFSARADLVEVYVSVLDRDDRPVVDVPREAFHVFENGVPQTIAAFAAGELPLTVGIAVDRSFSMRGAPLALARRGASRLIDALSPGDQAMVVAIGSRVEVIAPLSRDRAPARNAVDGLDAWGTSPLGDGVIAALNTLTTGTGRRALILFTDGNERYNATERTAVLETVRRADVMVYPVAVVRANAPLLAELAAASGGRAFDGRDDRAVTQASMTIADELRHQYLLGYAPPHPSIGGGTWRAIRVTVDRPALTVRAREGYFAREP
jgi:Ca-activated chloride channel homolog